MLALAYGVFVCDGLRTPSCVGTGAAVHCVWTGQQLDPAVLDIDHGLPRTACWRGGKRPTSLPAMPRCSGASPREAWANLPAMDGMAGPPDLDAVHAAVGLQRLRLRQDQQVPEWAG